MISDTEFIALMRDPKHERTDREKKRLCLLATGETWYQGDSMLCDMAELRLKLQNQKELVAAFQEVIGSRDSQIEEQAERIAALEAERDEAYRVSTDNWNKWQAAESRLSAVREACEEIAELKARVAELEKALDGQIAAQVAEFMKQYRIDFVLKEPNRLIEQAERIAALEAELKQATDFNVLQRQNFEVMQGRMRDYALKFQAAESRLSAVREALDRMRCEDSDCDECAGLNRILALLDAEPKHLDTVTDYSEVAALRAKLGSVREALETLSMNYVVFDPEPFRKRFEATMENLLALLDSPVPTHSDTEPKSRTALAVGDPQGIVVDGNSATIDAEPKPKPCPAKRPEWPDWDHADCQRCGGSRIDSPAPTLNDDEQPFMDYSREDAILAEEERAEAEIAANELNSSVAPAPTHPDTERCEEFLDREWIRGAQFGRDASPEEFQQAIAARQREIAAARKESHD